MILVRDPDAPDRPREAVGRRLFGNPDEAFLQSKPKLRPAHAGRSPRDRAGANGHRPVEHRLGHRRRQRLGEHRSGPNGVRRRGLRHRNGRRGPRPHPRKRRALRRGERERRPRPGAGSLRRAARPGRRVHRRRRPRSDRASPKPPIDRLRPGGRLVVNTTSIDHLAELRADAEPAFVATSTSG